MSKSVASSIKAHFTKTVGLASTPLSASIYTVERAVLIQADSANTGTVFVGDATVSTANGISLAKGDAITFSLDNPGPQINLISDVAAQKVRVIIL